MTTMLNKVAVAGDITQAIAEGEITITISEADVDFSRYSDGDIEL